MCISWFSLPFKRPVRGDLVPAVLTTASIRCGFLHFTRPPDPCRSRDPAFEWNEKQKRSFPSAEILSASSTGQAAVIGNFKSCRGGVRVSGTTRGWLRFSWIYGSDVGRRAAAKRIWRSASNSSYSLASSRCMTAVRPVQPWPPRDLMQPHSSSASEPDLAFPSSCRIQNSRRAAGESIPGAGGEGLEGLGISAVDVKRRRVVHGSRHKRQVDGGRSLV